MRKHDHSSGDAIVDRRASYAQALASEQDHAAAAEVMEQALRDAPGWAAGWHHLGRFREHAGDLEGAMAAWRMSASLDAAGVYGAALKLAAYGEGRAVQSARYVETLFDDYASRFEASLVGKLGYDIPSELMGLIAARLAERGIRQVASALDLGCGTGLMGAELRVVVARLEGVDLSEAMLAEARRKGVYDRLRRAEMLADMADRQDRFDLITATDVVNYVGDLAPVLGAVRRALKPGGMFGLSLETHAGPEPLLLRTNLRYAHNLDAARAASRAAGFEIIDEQVTRIRMDRGEPVAGALLLLE